MLKITFCDCSIAENTIFANKHDIIDLYSIYFTFTKHNKTMNAVVRIFFILIGLSASYVFGACPFSRYTDVVTACTGANDLGIVYPAGISHEEVSFFLCVRTNGPERGIPMELVVLMRLHLLLGML